MVNEKRVSCDDLILVQYEILQFFLIFRLTVINSKVFLDLLKGKQKQSRHIKDMQGKKYITECLPEKYIISTIFSAAPIRLIESSAPLSNSYLIE